MLVVGEESKTNSAVSAMKRPLAVMDLRTVLNDTDEDIFPASSGVYKKSYGSTEPAIKSESDIEIDKDKLINRTKLIKDLRQDIEDGRDRIAKVTKELSGFKKLHGEILVKHENVGDVMRLELQNKAALETRTKQTEKRADRANTEEAKLREQFEKLALRHKTAELTVSAMGATYEDEIAEETTRLNEIIVSLEAEYKSLSAEVQVRTDATDMMRLDYQRESTRAAEVCREVEQAKDEMTDLKNRAAGDELRLRSEHMEIELSLRDDTIRQLSLEVENLEEHLRRLEIEQQRRVAKFASRPTTSFARRTRSPATSSLSRGCSPATMSGTGPTNNSHSNGNGHRLQYSQKV
ncbi:uncharacterized protein V1513DRAFT_435351 [Lipomyces chichibuensis]|uniref:uncharacterized protein n=1 Tax=Lipomyces chichibuensis TaxID=1546026 RepID=UPI0033441DB7